MSSAAPFVSSTQRPIPLQARTDLQMRLIDYAGVGSWVVKDAVALKYHRLRAEQYELLRLLDGRRCLEEIRDRLKLAFPTLNFSYSDLQQLITDLHDKRLVYSGRYGQADVLLAQARKRRREKFRSTLKSVLFLKLPGWDPDRLLAWLLPAVSWTFRPWAVALAAVVVLASWTLLLVQFDDFQRRLPEFQQFFGWPNLIYLWLTLAGAKILHEFGHGLSCKHFGSECHEMGVMLLVFSPCLYCDVSDSWMLRSKWQRIAIAAAGMYVEVVLSAIAIFVWWNTTPGLLHYAALNLFFVTTITTVIFNANPLMRLDGYYILSDLVELPNLRTKAEKLLRDAFAWHCLGIESRPDPFTPDRGRGWLAAYAVAAAVYRWVVVFGVTLFLYTVLKPYRLQSIGIALAVFSLCGIAGGLLWHLYRLLSAPRSEPMSLKRASLTLAIVAALVAAAAFIPLPLHVKAAFVIEPDDVRHVFVTEPGRLAELAVEPGARVGAGEVVLKLESPELEDRLRRLQVEREAQQVTRSMHFALDEDAQEQLAVQRLQSLDEQIQELQQRLNQLDVKAPITGVVVEPSPAPEPTLAQQQTRLTSWHGTPLDAKNVGCWLDERTHLLSLAPNERRNAVLLVDQADRNDLAVGQPVEIRFEHLLDRTYHGTIGSISLRHREDSPDEVSVKSGGELPTFTDAEGREKLASIAYEATVLLDQDADLLMPGMRGQARFLVTRRSAGGWLWRYVRQTFHFRL